jgi:uncharacterized protein YdaU (DUF1376 family)
MHYYQHHIGDFIRDTANLTDSQSMTYLRLIWTYYDTEQPIEDAIKKLAFKLGSDAETVELLLETFFKKEADGWHHKRIDAEISAYQTKGEKARENANARWSNSRRNADAMQPQCDGIAPAMPLHDSSSKVDANQQPITNNQQPVNKNPPTPLAGGGNKFDPLNMSLPDSVPSSAWEEWITYRRSRRLTCSEPTMVKQLRYLTEASTRGNPPEGLIDTAIRNGWQGLFEPSSPPARSHSEPVRRQARQVYQ